MQCTDSLLPPLSEPEGSDRVPLPILTPVHRPLPHVEHHGDDRGADLLRHGAQHREAVRHAEIVRAAAQHGLRPVIPVPAHPGVLLRVLLEGGEVGQDLVVRLFVIPQALARDKVQHVPRRVGQGPHEGQPGDAEYGAVFRDVPDLLQGLLLHQQVDIQKDDILAGPVGVASRIIGPAGGHAHEIASGVGPEHRKPALLLVVDLDVNALLRRAYPVFHIQNVKIQKKLMRKYQNYIQ